jgi:hypothetical protein
MRRDRGFVLVDAVVASAILAVVGTAAVTLAMTVLSRGDDLLDRSLTLINLESKSYEVMAVGADGITLLDPSPDGVFDYAVQIQSGAPVEGALVSVLVEAKSAGSEQSLRSVGLLVARRGFYP